MQFLMKCLLRLFTRCGWHFRWQCLDEPPGKKEGRLWKEGRCWLDNSQEYEDDQGKYHYRRETWTARAEWGVGRKSCRLALEFGTGDADRGITFSFAVPLLFSIWLELDSPWSGSVCRRWLPTRVSRVCGEEVTFYDPRVISLRVFDWAIWWDLWMHPDEWKANEPWYRRENFRPIDFLFGRLDYSKEDISSGTALVPMPEGCYEATYKIEYCEWTRKRWPWFPLKKTRLCADIKVPGGIPVPGKGENSWDCGDNAVFGLSCSAQNRWEVIGQLVTSVMRSRIRYGGSERMDHVGAGFGEYLEPINKGR